jgi:hypothetical protein
MSLGGHIGNIRLRHSKEKRIAGRSGGIAKMRSCRTLGRPISAFRGAD